MSEAVDSLEQIRGMTERTIKSCVQDLIEGNITPEPLDEVTKKILIYYDKEMGTEEAVRQAIKPVIERCQKQNPVFKINCRVDKNAIIVHVFR